MFRQLRYFILSLVVFFQTSNSGLTQPKGLDPEKWAIELSKKDYSANESARKLDSRLASLDSTRIFKFLDQLQEKRGQREIISRPGSIVIKARELFFANASYQAKQQNYPANLDRVKGPVNKLLSAAMDIAYRTEDDYLVAFVSYTYAITIVRFGEVGVAVMYAKNGIDLDEKLLRNIPAREYQFLAEMLYTVREYGDCVHYSKKAVSAWQRSSEESALHMTVSCIDYNQDGSFAKTERVVTGRKSSTFSKNFTIPSTAKNGFTRMRVMMHYDSALKQPCGDFINGEAEDYTVIVTGGTGAIVASDAGTSEAAQAAAMSSILVIPNPVNSSSATAILNMIKEGSASLKITDISGRALYKKDVTNLYTGKNPVALNQLATLSDGVYMVEVEQNGVLIGRGRIVVNK